MNRYEGGMTIRIIAYMLPMLLLWGCSSRTSRTSIDAGANDGDIDGDADTDSDADTDWDSDTDDDTDADTDTEIDGGTDGDTDVDTETNTFEKASPMTDCANGAGKLDPETELCWQEPPPDEKINWYEAMGIEGVSGDKVYNPDGGVDYCGDLEAGGLADWRVPNIDELISLVRGCVGYTTTGDMSRSLCGMTPEGCVETDSCEDKTNNCKQCPAASNENIRCYWDPTLTGMCGRYWSSSTRWGPPERAWIVNFSTSFVFPYGKDGVFAMNIRCVRNQIGDTDIDGGILDGSTSTSDNTI